jgi:hypothetical protein
MREHVEPSKKATTVFSIPALKQPIPGFSLQPLEASPAAVPETELLKIPPGHDISRISIHRPQAKLSISQPGDFYEQEADSVAQQVLQRIAKPQPQPVQTKSLADTITPLVQPQQLPEEELQAKSLVQRYSARNALAPTSDLESSIQQARGGGQPLADGVRQPMENAFGSDFSNVRIHTDTTSDNLNKSIQARAFTTGQDIFFRQGEYSPGSNSGQELLAHELTHVVQQNGNAVQRKTAPARKTDNLETLVSQPSQEIGIQRLCSECEKEQQQLLVEEKTEETLQAKEITGRPLNTNPDLADSTQPTSQLIKEENDTDPHQPETLQEGRENKSQAEIAGNELSSPSAEGTEPPPEDPKSLDENSENRQVEQEKLVAKEISESSSSLEVTAPEDKSPINAEANSTASEAVGGKDEELENLPPGGQSVDNPAMTGEKAPSLNPEAVDKGVGTDNELGNLPPTAQDVDNAGVGGEKTPDQTSPAIGGQAASPETVAEKEQAITTAFQAQEQQKIINTQTAQLVATGVNFVLPQPEGIDQQENNPEFFEQQRATASNITNEFLATAVLRIQTITQLNEGISARIQGSAENAKALVIAAVEQQKAIVAAQIAQERDQTQSQAQAIIAQIQAQHQTAVATTTQTTATNRQKVATEYTTSLQKLTENEQNQLSRIEELYTQARDKYRAAGEKIGNEAIALGEQKATQWESQITGKDDNFWDGPLTDNKLKARAKAAREVAQQYKNGLIEEANKQADAVGEGKPKDIEAIHNVANESRQQLETLQQQSLDNLNAVEQQVLSQLAQAQTQLTQTANQTLEATLQSLNEQQAAQLQLLEAYGQRQVVAIERDAEKAIASIQDGINQAAANLQTVLQDTQNQLQGMAAPNPDELSIALADILGQFDNAVGQVQEQTDKGITASEQGITGGGQQAVTGVSAIAQTGLQESTAVSQGAKTTLTNLNQGATNTFNQIQQAFTTTVTKTSETAVTGFGQTTQGVETAFKQVNENLDSNFQKSANDLEEGLRGALQGSKEPNLQSDIQKYADEAADQEQPRWKTVLKVLLVIAVIVVAIVVAPAVIGAVGAVAGALGASAAAAGAIGAVVGGAIVGAVAGAVVQIGNNAIDGKNLLDGVGKAALVGAIGGALGGAGGVLGNALGQAGKLGAGLTQSVLKFGIDVAFDIAGGIAGDLAVGNPITVEGILIGAGIGAAVQISTANLGRLGKFGRGVQGMQSRTFQAGEQFGSSVGNRIKTGFGGKVDTPTVGSLDGGVTGVKSPEMDGKVPDTEVKAPQTGVTAPETQAKPPNRLDISDTPTQSASVRETSVKESGRIESDQLSSRQIKNEADYVKDHPEIIEGNAPKRRAKIDEHEWAEEPNGTWCRHSNAAVCVANFDQTRAEMRQGKETSPVRQIDETGRIEAFEAYELRLQELNNKVLDYIDKNEKTLAKLEESPEINKNKIDEIKDHLKKLEKLYNDTDNRLTVLRESQQASDSSLSQQSPRESWSDLDIKKTNLIDEAEPINPTNMSDSDIEKWLQYYNNKQKPNSQDKRRRQWLDHEKTYRETLKKIEEAKKNYGKVVGKKDTIDEADRKLVVDALTNGREVLWVNSAEQAERIFYTLNEMTKTGEVVTMRPPKGATVEGRKDLPFRGPERHPFPDRGANRSTHFNAEYIYEGKNVNLHIYWPQ